jgi:hypothetical protein
MNRAKRERCGWASRSHLINLLRPGPCRPDGLESEARSVGAYEPLAAVVRRGEARERRRICRPRAEACCSSTRSPSWTSRCRRSSCARWRPGRWFHSEPRGRWWWTSAWSPRRTRACARRSRPASCARICSSASRGPRSGSRRCVSGKRRSRGWSTQRSVSSSMRFAEGREEAQSRLRRNARHEATSGIGERCLRATGAPLRRSRARKTTPMPPAPTWRSISKRSAMIAGHCMMPEARCPGTLAEASAARTGANPPGSPPGPPVTGPLRHWAKNRR